MKKAKISGKWEKQVPPSNFLKMWKLTPYLVGPQLVMISVTYSLIYMI